MWLGHDRYTRRHAGKSPFSKRILDLTPRGEFEELVQLCMAYFMLYRNTRCRDSVKVDWYERASQYDSDTINIWVEITANTKHEKPEALRIEASIIEGEYVIYEAKMRSFDIETDLFERVEWFIADVRTDAETGHACFWPMDVSQVRELVVERVADLIDSVSVIIPKIR